MQLAEALRALPDSELRGDPTTEVIDVTHDSRAVVAGSLFCCLRGGTTDGHRFAAGAVDQGATALLVEEHVDVSPPVAQIRVDDARASMAPLAARVHGDPSRSLAVVGVTGTNGKTTTTMLLGHALGRLARPAAVLGTLSGARTTPEASDLQRWLAARRDDGTEVVAMEVSSHALDRHRVDATRFAVAVFTNLTADHLDYHGTMERYFAAKARLFRPDFTANAVINTDDPHGRRLTEQVRREHPDIAVVEVSLDAAGDLDLRPDGATFRWRDHPVELALAGRFNVANALAAAETLVLLGHEPQDVAAALSGPVVVPGRYERVDVGQPFTVIVDFAHTPDGLASVLGAASESLGPSGAVRVVFGCGGDRDPAKRPLMGAESARNADHVILTADNSRHESTDVILGAIRAGFEAVEPRRASRLDVVPDRREAIRLAMASAAAGDIVVLAGKGHETSQTIGDTVTPFDDREAARIALADLGGWTL